MFVWFHSAGHLHLCLQVCFYVSDFVCKHPRKNYKGPTVGRHQKSIKSERKNKQKIIKKCIKNCKKSIKNDKKSLKKQKRAPSEISTPFGSKFEGKLARPQKWKWVKIRSKSTKNQKKGSSKIDVFLGTFPGGIFHDFGSKMDSKMGGNRVAKETLDKIADFSRHCIFCRDRKSVV